MDEQRQKLLGLVEKMNFPVTEEEAVANIKGYTDQEVADLISLYSDISEYETAMEDYVRENSPDEYNKLVEAREEELKKKDAEDEYESEKVQEEEDLELDSLEVQEERIIDDIVKPVEELADITESVEDDIEKAVASAKTSSQTV